MNKKIRLIDFETDKQRYHSEMINIYTNKAKTSEGELEGKHNALMVAKWHEEELKELGLQPLTHEEIYYIEED